MANKHAPLSRRVTDRSLALALSWQISTCARLELFYWGSGERGHFCGESVEFIKLFEKHWTLKKKKKPLNITPDIFGSGKRSRPDWPSWLLGADTTEGSGIQSTPALSSLQEYWLELRDWEAQQTTVLGASRKQTDFVDPNIPAGSFKTMMLMVDVLMLSPEVKLSRKKWLWKPGNRVLSCSQALHLCPCPRPDVIMALRWLNLPWTAIGYLWTSYLSLDSEQIILTLYLIYLQSPADPGLDRLFRDNMSPSLLLPGKTPAFTFLLCTWRKDLLLLS